MKGFIVTELAPGESRDSDDGSYRPNGEPLPEWDDADDEDPRLFAYFTGEQLLAELEAKENHQRLRAQVRSVGIVNQLLLFWARLVGGASGQMTT